MNYTKGEWKVWDARPHYSIRVGRKNVATISSLNNTPNEEKEANAHLIAAAPEMYEALKGIHNYLLGIWGVPYRDGLRGFVMGRSIQQAISKAEGK